MRINKFKKSKFNNSTHGLTNFNDCLNDGHLLSLNKIFINSTRLY